MSKLRLSCFSDLHLEFEGYKWQIPELDTDLLILAGDIGNGLFGIEWAIRQSERLNLDLCWVFGNHSFYNNALNLVEKAREYCNGTKVHILEKNVFELKGYRILGTTWWIDYLAHGEVNRWIAMDTAKKYMADHRYIDKGHFQPEDALRLHNEADDWIKSELGRSTKEIVVTHHAPTHFSISPVYRGDLMSPAFFNDREEFILERQPLIWINGHTHFNIDMMIGNTRVISNQRGYKNEGVQGFNPNLVIEV